MRTPVYRNLDTPFQIFGYNALELTVLCFVLVGGGEILQIFAIHRIWAFLLTFILAATLFCLHRWLGRLFLRRLIRFIQLPSYLHPSLLILNKKGS